MVCWPKQRVHGKINMLGKTCRHPHAHRDMRGKLVAKWDGPAGALYSTAYDVVASWHDDGKLLLRNLRAPKRVAWSGKGSSKVCKKWLCRRVANTMCTPCTHTHRVTPPRSRSSAQPCFSRAETRAVCTCGTFVQALHQCLIIRCPTSFSPLMLCTREPVATIHPTTPL